MQSHFGETEFIVRLHGNIHFLDGACLVVMPGFAMITFGGSALRASMKKSFEAHRLTLIERGDVIHAVFFEANRALVNISFAARKLNLLFVVEDEDAITKRLVGLDFKIRVGTLDRSQVAAALFDHILHVRP